jgi:hypothetical protein
MTPVVVFVSFLLLLLTWLLLSGMNLNSTPFESELRALDEFSRFERGLNREVLSARVGLSRNYDALAQIADAYEHSLNRLHEVAGPDSEESAAIEVLAVRAHRQQDLVEKFKMRNALLRNSLVYFGTFSARLAASDDRPVVAPPARSPPPYCISRLIHPRSPWAMSRIGWCNLRPCKAHPAKPRRFRRRSRMEEYCMTCCR